MCPEKPSIYVSHHHELELNTQNFQGESVEKLNGNFIRKGRVKNMNKVGIGKRQKPGFRILSIGSSVNPYNQMKAIP